MTVSPLSAGPHEAGLFVAPVLPEAVEPSRFAAYSTGCDPSPIGGVERVLALVERLLVPGLRS